MFDQNQERDSKGRFGHDLGSNPWRIVGLATVIACPILLVAFVLFVLWFNS